LTLLEALNITEESKKTNFTHFLHWCGFFPKVLVCGCFVIGGNLISISMRDQQICSVGITPLKDDKQVMELREETGCEAVIFYQNNNLFYHNGPSESTLLIQADRTTKLA